MSYCKVAKLFSVLMTFFFFSLAIVQIPKVQE